MKSNSPVKVLILIIGIAVAACAVLFFLKTIVTPPTNVDVNNLHIKSIEKDVKNLTESKSMSYNDSLYVLLNDKIEVFSNEGFLSTAEKDAQIKEFILKYVPVFKAICTKRFNSPNWDDTDFRAWRKRITDLQKIALSDGTVVVQGTNKNDLANIVGVMDDYKTAKGIAAIRSFTSVAKAKTDITSANNYASRPYIEHSKVAGSLKKVKENIGEAHYKNLVLKVHELCNYEFMSQTEFQSLVNEVNNALTEYDANKSIYGSAAKDLASLKTDAGKYVSAANQYYTAQSQPSIRVNLNSSWTSATSPNSSFKAYRSYSNLGQSNSKATMSFEIKGYSSFTFYIDSYAESTYDYVMVGNLNQMPTETSNYANTSGWQKASTSFSNYKTVTFNNLGRTTTYRIYVVYMKDGSNNNNDDRGYVLLPNIAQ